MDIRQLHYFLTLCEEMNYTRAAQRLFLSRQALRQSISALEAEMCGPLFISAHHKLALTDRGMSLQRHAAPVVEQFQQMQAALRAEIQSAQPVRIGISVALVPDYLPGLETQLDKFRQQYPHVEMRFRLLDNDAVADGVEQGELDAGLVIDLGCAAPVLARTTLRAVNVERRFLIRMNGQQGSDDCRFFECREDSLYPYFSFTMQFADCPTERMCSLLCPESPLSF